MSDAADIGETSDSEITRLSESPVVPGLPAADQSPPAGIEHWANHRVNELAKEFAMLHVEAVVVVVSRSFKEPVISLISRTPSAGRGLLRHAVDQLSKEAERPVGIVVPEKPGLIVPNGG